jgi:hypothetical protein
VWGGGGLTWNMHVETQLLDCVGYVRSSEGEVLESHGQAPIDCQVTDRGTRVGGDLGSSVHGHGTRLAVGYTNTLKDIQIIVELLQKEVIGSLLH